MNAAYANPFSNKYDQFNPELLRSFLREKKSRSGMGDFWSDLGNTVTDAISGLSEAVGKAFDAIVKTVGQIMQTLALVIEACVGQVSWKDVLNSAGKVFQDIGSVLVAIDPLRIVYTWLSKAPLTSHAFHELDKFTGGMLTGITNLSDLPGRVLRGDAISKTELIRDALFVIEVVAIVFTGPVGLGLVVGSMFGREVCKHQTEYQGACMGVFQIVGAAVGDYAASSSAFLDTLSDAGEKYLTNQGITAATQVAVVQCQKSDWAGKKECQIMGTVLADYIKSDGSQDWETFLGTEIVKLGVPDMMLQWFPPNSPEHAAIQKQWTVTSVTGSTAPATVIQKMNPWTYFLLAAGAVTLAVGGAS